MKIFICTFTLLLLIFVVSKIKNTDMKTEKAFLPDQIVNQFIDFSILGNEKGIDSLITNQPNSYLYFCDKSNDENLEQNSSIPSIISTAESERRINDKFSNSLEHHQNSLALLEAEYIYSTHSAFIDIKITSTKIYQDEAIVKVEYIGLGESVREKTFLLKNIEGWKIFSTISPGTLKSTINENYAAPRPLCNQE